MTEPKTPEEIRMESLLQRVVPKLATQRHTYQEEDFLYDVGADAYWCIPMAALLKAKAVDSMIPKKSWRIPPAPPNAVKPPEPVRPSVDIARIERDRLVEGSTWLPGHGKIVQDLLVNNTGFFPHPGARLFNTFRPGPVADKNRAHEAGPWIAHIKKLWPEEREHNFFFDYCAHMVQKPQEKCNAAIVLSGKQGIGKDMALLPLRAAIGEWNATNIGPDELLDKYSPWCQTVMLTVDEVRPTEKDHHATTMYDRSKTLITTPPHTLPMNQKYEQIRYVANVLRMFLTTNDRLAMYIPPDDRRIMLMHSYLPAAWHVAEGQDDYFVKFASWMFTGGNEAVAGWLYNRDLSKFDPKGQVPKTEAWAEVAQSWTGGDDEISEALDKLGYPDVVLGSEILDASFDNADKVMGIMRSKSFLFKMEKEGYIAVPLLPGTKKWRSVRDGLAIKSSRAFIKESARGSAQENQQRVLAHIDVTLDKRTKGRAPGATITELRPPKNGF